MKSKRFSEEQIIGTLKQAQAGMKIVDLCRQHGISDATFYNWRSKYGGMEVSEAKRLKALENENRQLKHLLADAMLENRAMSGNCRICPAGGVVQPRFRYLAPRSSAPRLLGKQVARWGSLLAVGVG